MNEIFEEIKRDMDDFFQEIDKPIGRDPEEVDVITDHLPDPMDDDDEKRVLGNERRYTMVFKTLIKTIYPVLEFLTLVWIFVVFGILMILGNV